MLSSTVVYPARSLSRYQCLRNNYTTIKMIAHEMLRNDLRKRLSKASIGSPSKNDSNVILLRMSGMKRKSHSSIGGTEKKTIY